MKKLYMLGVIVSVLISYNVCAVEEIKNENQWNDIIGNNQYVVADFFALWCGPCKRLAPILEAVEKELTQVKFVKVNTDTMHGLANKYNIQSLPTVILLKDGKKVGGSLIGLKQKNELISLIKQRFGI